MSLNSKGSESKAFSTAALSVTSSSKGKIKLGYRSFKASSLSNLLAAAITLKPFEANTLAISRPKPAEAPVTKAIL